MKWVSFKERKPSDDIPYVARIGTTGYDLFLCTQLGKELHITDVKQWQWVFTEGEKVEIEGRELEYWLEI